MAYIPPHKRHSKNSDSPSPVPMSVAPPFKRSLNLRSTKANKNVAGKIVYANNAINEWFAVGLKADQNLLSSASIKLVSVEAIERRTGRKSLALFANNPSEYGEVKDASLEKPWLQISEIVLQHLISSFEVFRNVSEVENEVETKPELVVRFGKNLFNRSPTMGVEDAHSWVSVSSFKSLQRTFYTNLPSAYLKNVEDVVVPEIGFKCKDKKDLYHVKLSDKLRPDAAISCKCSLIREEQKLELFKVELNAVRHMVADISCLNRDLDLRLMVSAKRTLKALSEEEITIITGLISSAVVDPNVKGGLRWPFGKNFFGDRYDIVGVWHIVSQTYENSTMVLKVRQADRFDFRLSMGEVTGEVTLKLKKIASALSEHNLEADVISDMLGNVLKLIWEHFLKSENSALEGMALV